MYCTVEYTNVTIYEVPEQHGPVNLVGRVVWLIGTGTEVISDWVKVRYGTAVRYSVGKPNFEPPLSGAYTGFGSGGGALFKISLLSTA